MAAGLVAAAPVVGSLTLAPAAEAAATAAVGVNFTGTASAATATFTSGLPTDAVVYIRVEKPGPNGSVVVVSSTPVTIKAGSMSNLTTTIAHVTVPYLATASVVDVNGNTTFFGPGSIYTNTTPDVPEVPVQMTPAPVLPVSANLYTVPSVTGYHYEVGGKVVPDGNFYVPVGGATIIAVSDNPTKLQLVGKTSWQLSYVTPPKPDEGSKKVMICHATGSDKNPYVAIPVSVASLRDGHGHAGHADDIWPEFTYKGGDDYLVTVPAQNWDTGKKIYEAGCKVMPTPPSGDHGHDHGGDKGDDHGSDHGGTTGGNTGGTSTGGTTGNTGGTTTSGSTTNTTSSSSVVTVQRPQAPAPVANQAPVAAPAPATSSGPVVMRAATAADPTDASNLGVAAGIALVAAGGLGAVMLFRRPKHQA